MTADRMRRAGRGLVALAALLLSGASATGESVESSGDPGKGFPGVLLPHLDVSLSPMVEGRLLRLHVRIGDRVRKDDLLAELDEEPIRRERAEAEGRLEEARAAETEATTRLAMAGEALERQRALSEQQIVSAEQLREAERQEELARVSLDRARAQVQQQVASLEQIDARLANTRVLAPFAGRVADSYAAPGASVEPGTPMLRLISDGALWARFAVPVDEARTMPMGAALRISVPDAAISLAGFIEHVGAAVDPASGMVIYEATVNTPADWDGPPLAGQTVRVWPADDAP